MVDIQFVMSIYGVNGFEIIISEHNGSEQWGSGVFFLLLLNYASMLA